MVSDHNYGACIVLLHFFCSILISWWVCDVNRNFLAEEGLFRGAILPPLRQGILDQIDYAGFILVARDCTFDLFQIYLVFCQEVEAD